MGIPTHLWAWGWAKVHYSDAQLQGTAELINLGEFMSTADPYRTLLAKKSLNWLTLAHAHVIFPEYFKFPTDVLVKF